MDEKDSSQKEAASADNSPTDQKEHHADGTQNREKHHGRRLEEYIRHHGQTIEIVSTGVIAAFTVALFLTSYCQWSATRQALRLSRDSLEITQRARLETVSFRPPPLEAGRPLTAGVTYKNVGHVPAEQIQAYRYSEPVRIAVVPRVTRQPVRSDLPILGPDSTREFPVEIRALEPQEVTDLQEGRLFLYVWGCLRYLDGFRQAWRRTAFCAVYRFEPAAKQMAFGDCRQSEEDYADYCPEPPVPSTP
jgi:hypothetical protein